MTKQTKGAIVAAAVSLVFLVLEIAVGIQTGLAGIFIMGMAGGLLVGNEMAKPAKP